MTKFFKVRYWVALLIFFIIGVNACTKADVNFGGQYIDDEYGQLVLLDTLSPTVSTIYLDSFQTSATGYGVVGSYTDPIFGKINAHSYFQLVPPAYSLNNEDSFRYAIYDSITLLIHLSQTSYYGDTASPLTINVHKLTQKIDYYNSQTSILYNTQEFGYDPTPIGTKTFILRPNSGSFFDTVSIRLDDALGQDLWNKMRTSDPNIQTNEQFINYFRGIRLSSPAANSFVTGMTDSIEMRIHYRTPSTEGIDNRIALFTLYDKTLQFNHIDIDRTGTVLGQQGISSANKVISTKQTGNKAYLQSITGTAVKISFPQIKNLLIIPNYVKMTRALLRIQPTYNTYRGFYTLPGQLRLSSTDFNNYIGADLSYSSAVQYGSLSYDYTNGGRATYSYEMTAYLNSLLSSTTYIEGEGLILSPPTPAFSTQCNRLVFDDYEGDENNRIKLEVYYLAVK